MESRSFSKKVFQNNSRSDIFFTGGESNSGSHLRTGKSVEMRTNYNTSSRVFNTDVSLDSSSSTPKYSRTKSVFQSSEFVPKYKDENAFKRKLKEFYKENEVTQELGKNVTSSKGVFFKEINFGSTVLRKSIDLENLTSKERKIKDLYPNVGIQDLKKLNISQSNTNNRDNLPETRRLAKSSVSSKSFSESNFSSRAYKVASMRSNIFNTEESNRIYTPVLTEKEEKSNNTITTPSKKIQKTKWSNKLDWKSTNTELLFDKENDLKAASVDKYSPSKMKMKNLVGHLEERKEIVNYEPISVKPHVLEQEKNNKPSEEVKLKFQEKFGNDKKYKRTINQASTLHDKDFYSNALKVSKIDRPVTDYEIVNIKDYDNFNLSEMKSMFAQRGIHIYGVNMHGKYYNGNQTGKLAFKIRNNEDDSNFNAKLKEVNDTIKGKGYDLKTKIANTHKPSANDTLPTSVKWTNPNLSSMVKNKTGFAAEGTKLANTSEKIKSSEKFSKYKIDTTYKKPIQSHNTAFKTSGTTSLAASIKKK